MTAEVKQATNHQLVVKSPSPPLSAWKIIGAVGAAAGLLFSALSGNITQVSREAIPLSCRPGPALGLYDVERRVRQFPLPEFEYEGRTPHPGIVLLDQGTTGYFLPKAALQEQHGSHTKMTRYLDRHFAGNPQIRKAKETALSTDSKGFGVGGTNPETGITTTATLAVSPQKLPNQKQAIAQAGRLAAKAAGSTPEQTTDRILSLHGTAVQGFDAAKGGSFREKHSMVFKDDRMGRTDSDLIQAVRARGDKQDVEIFSKQVLPKLRKGNIHKLTPKEKEVFGLIARVPPPPEKIPELMRDYAIALNDGFRQMEQCQNFDPVGFAAWAHQKLTEIHPFGDGNGRTARLVQNAILKKAGYPPAVFDSDDAYMEAVGKDFEEPGTYARFLNERIDWTQRELVEADPCLPQLTC